MLYKYSKNLYTNNNTYVNTTSKRITSNSIYIANNTLKVDNIENMEQNFYDPSQTLPDDDWDPPEDPE